MDVVSLCPLVASKLVWHAHTGACALTVIIKATFVLVPGTALVAPQQEPVLDHDVYWDDDPRRSVQIPSDRVPYKLRPEVMLVGNAYAPAKQPVRSLVTRVVVGEMDKSIEVWGDRTCRAHDGQIFEAQRFTRMPLTWERAAGGPESANPVGKRFDATPDAYGAIQIANLQPIGTLVSKREDTFVPVCYGPISPRWSGRAQRLGSLSRKFVEGGWEDEPLPPDFDATFFQAAPPDQQIVSLRSNERIVLEHLHAEHARLVTNLPGLSPRAIASRATGEQEKIHLILDTLWIDTDRGLCCVVWRGMIGLRMPDEEGKIIITIAEEAEDRLFTDGIAITPAPIASDGCDEAGAMTLVGSYATDASGPVLPFAGGDLPATSRTERNPSTRDGALPFSPINAAPAATAIASSPPMQPPMPPLWLGNMTPPLGTQADRSPRVETSMVDGPLARGQAKPAFPMRAPEPAIQFSHDPMAALGGVAAASDAAGARPASTTEPVATPLNTAAGRARALPSEYVDLIWFNEQAPLRVRQYAEWGDYWREPQRVAEWLSVDAMEEAPRAAVNTREIRRALGRVPPLDAAGITQALMAAIDEDGILSRPLAIVNGELTMILDSVEVLKATIFVAAQLGSTDKRLKEILDSAEELIKGDRNMAVPLIDAALSRIRQAFVQANRTLGADYLDMTVQRLLVRERRYLVRRVFGGPHICGLLAMGGQTQLPTYMPEHLAEKLPLFHKFNIRALVEPHAQQDPSETEPVALLVLALARLIPVESRNRRAPPGA